MEGYIYKNLLSWLLLQRGTTGERWENLVFDFVWFDFFYNVPVEQT